MKRKIVFLLLSSAIMLTACSNLNSGENVTNSTNSESHSTEVIETDSSLDTDSEPSQDSSTKNSNILLLEEYYNKEDSEAAEFFKLNQGHFRDMIQTNRGVYILTDDKKLYTFDNAYSENEVELEFTFDKDMKAINSIIDLDISDNIVCEDMDGNIDMYYLEPFEIAGKNEAKGYIGSYDNTAICINKIMPYGSHNYIDTIHLENNQVIHKHNCIYKYEKDCQSTEQQLDVNDGTIKSIGSIGNKLFIINGDNEMRWVEDITKSPIKLSSTVVLKDFEKFINNEEYNTCSHFIVPAYKKIGDETAIYSVNYKLTISPNDDTEVKIIMPEGKKASDIVSVKYFGFVFKDSALIEFADGDYYISSTISKETEAISLTKIEELSKFNKEHKIQDVAFSDWKDLYCLTEDGKLYFVKLSKMK